MKKLLLTCCCMIAVAAYSQKKTLDHTVYDGWQTAGNINLSPKGNILTYEINPQEGDGELIVRNVKKGSRLTISRGYRASILDNEQVVVCLIKPFFKDTRQAKIKKKSADDMPKDSLAIISMKDFSVHKFPQVLNYKVGKHGVDAVAFTTSDTALIPKKERKDKNVGKPMLLCHLSNTLLYNIDTLRHVSQFAFDKHGKYLALVMNEKKNKSLVGYYDVSARKLKLVPDTAAFYSLPQFNEDGSSMLFLQAADTLASGSKHCQLYQMDVDGSSSMAHARRLVGLEDMGSLPKGWGLTENSAPSFSHNGKHVFAGIQLLQAPKDTTIVPFETAGLDIWNYDAAELPPMMKANLSKDLKHVNTAFFDAQGHRLVPLSLSKFDALKMVDRGDADFMLSVDNTKTIVETQWNMQNDAEVSLVDLVTGKRTLVATGAFARVQASPKGNYVVWYDLRQRCWMLYDVRSKSLKGITSGIDANFWDEDDDHPMMPEPYGIAGWTEDDHDVLLYDHYDIWKVSTTDLKAVCLTGGEGRRTKCTYRYVQTKDPEEEPFIRRNETILLSIFDNVTKKNGFATVSVAKAASPQIAVLDGFTFGNAKKAKDAEVYAYTKGNFQCPNDIYLTRTLGRQEQKLTSINPQQKDYNWGTVELVHWNAYDGTRLDGLLYKPEDFDPTKKYPVMIYFYEKRSESLYSYVMPQPSWSTVNLAFYCSRGYLVFVPDIVYHAGTPGECAYNCIVSGAEALAKNPWVDKDNMAIQGQSWGGYQVAYLITRTNMFKAAGAGAPVANMTSAYGGIRWQTGMSRQFQYEQSQSRIGRDLWNGVELYMENSPLFKLPHVTTPVLIMHNDNDGAVPWYQGIEMFMGLRRLGKPAWLLEYNNEEHNLRERRNRKDLSVRLQQFFDHYLKGAPMPAWMKHGVPTIRKGEYFGFEEAE
ncbi:MAG: S9 family peptidase [Prevotella sp.]|nr:S9 family peptidase [Prevotella sp.]